MRIDQNLVAVVTGGSSGLGEATVKLLTSLGAKVVIADINQTKGKDVSTLTKAHFVKTDITDENQVKAVFQYTKTTFGKVDVAVNCAGVGVVGTIITSKGVLSNQSLQSAFKVNVVGSFNVAKYAAKMMSEQPLVDGERGVIILVSSLAGEEGQKGQTVYGATKGAVNGMVLPLARDLGKLNIRVMGIAPGVFLTPMTEVIPKKAKEHIFTQIPAGRFGQSPEFAKLSQAIIENPYVNGAIWRIDGAMRLPYL